MKMYGYKGQALTTEEIASKQLNYDTLFNIIHGTQIEASFIWKNLKDWLLCEGSLDEDLKDFLKSSYNKYYIIDYSRYCDLLRGSEIVLLNKQYNCYVLCVSADELGFYPTKSSITIPDNYPIMIDTNYCGSREA